MHATTVTWTRLLLLACKKCQKVGKTKIRFWVKAQPFEVQLSWKWSNSIFEENLSLMVQISAKKNLKRKISEQKYFWFSKNFDFFWKFFPWWGYKKKNCNLTTEKKFSKKKFFFWLLRLSSFFLKKSNFSKFFKFYQNGVLGVIWANFSFFYIILA